MNKYVIGRGPNKLSVKLSWMKPVPENAAELEDELVQRFASATMSVLKNRDRTLESRAIKESVGRADSRRKLVEDSFE